MRIAVVNSLGMGPITAGAAVSDYFVFPVFTSRNDEGARFFVRFAFVIKVFEFNPGLADASHKSRRVTVTADAVIPEW
jgi:hypothetical protein